MQPRSLLIATFSGLIVAGITAAASAVGPVGGAASCNGKTVEWEGSSERDHLIIGANTMNVNGEIVEHDDYVVVHTRGGNDIVHVTAPDGLTVVVCGGGGKDVLIAGGAGDTRVEFLGGSGNDVIGGAGGNDYLSGGKGNDSMLGGPGNDRMWGGRGDDNMSGKEGNDRFWGGKGDDSCFGGPGYDVGNCEFRQSVHPPGPNVPE